MRERCIRPVFRKKAVDFRTLSTARCGFMSDGILAKPSALLVGNLPALEMAYPPELRRDIAVRVELSDVSMDSRTWRNHADSLAGVRVILGTWGLPRMDAEFLAAAPNLEAVFYAAGSVKGFVTPESFERGITVCNANKANAIPVAEYAASAIVLSLKRFWQHGRKTHQAKTWRHLTVPGVYRSVVGLVSLGAVGRLTAERLRSYELDVLAYDPFASPEQAAALGVRLVSLEEIFSRSDVVSLHAPWLPETENLVDGRLLRLMKPGATLLNTSRGAVVNERELCAVLAERSDLTAVLDVTFPEPPAPDSPLFLLDNVFLTPHISGSMGGEVSRMGVWMVEEMRRYLEGEALHHAVTEPMLASMA